MPHPRAELPPKKPDELRIAHLSDLHISLRSSAIGRKADRLFRRCNLHNLAWARLLLDDVRRRDIDHLVVSGDLSNNGRLDQLTALRELLGDFDDPERMSVVPGNHDIRYRSLARVGDPAWKGAAKFKPFFTVFGHLVPPSHPDDLGLPKPTMMPYVKYLGAERDVALIGLDTTSGFTSPVPGLNAVGKVPRGHYKHLRELLAAEALENRMKIVLMHHHPMIVPFHFWFDNFKVLRNSMKIMDLLYQRGVALILHGHKHTPFCWQAHTFDNREFTVVCAGPPDAYNKRDVLPVELVYNIYSIRDEEVKIHYQRCPVSEETREELTRAPR